MNALEKWAYGTALGCDECRLEDLESDDGAVRVALHLCSSHELEYLRRVADARPRLVEGES